ncbi:MAG: DoxX family membrane protein [Candidatus Dormibacteraeota bacterium]|nr:DoxX family membrane protein [Candidatus Dormibacteraeota bacterium]
MSKSDIGLLTLRIVTGGILAAHGLPKLFGGPGRRPPGPLSSLLGANYAPAWEKSGPANFAEHLGQMGIPLPEFAAAASGVSELAGGLGLMLGAATPIASAASAANMAVAVRQAHWKTGPYGQGGYEFALLLGVAAMAIGLTGPGRISVDRLFS